MAEPRVTVLGTGIMGSGMARTMFGSLAEPVTLAEGLSGAGKDAQAIRQTIDGS